MFTKSRSVDNYLLGGIALIFLAYIPRLWDPSVFPKFVVATLLACSLLPLTLKTLRASIAVDNTIKSLVVATGLLLIIGFISTLVSDDHFTALFGLASRYNGFIGFHIALSFIFIGRAVGSKDLTRRFLWLLSLTALFESIIGLAQKNGYVLIVAKNLYSPIIGTFGNPNFFSAFLGFGSISTLYLIFASKTIVIRFSLLLNLSLCLLVMYWSESIQGLFMFALGSIILITKVIQSGAKKSYLIIWASFIIFSTYFVVIGLLNRGPLKVFLFQESTFYRFDYWRAAIRMIKTHLLLGVGPDQYQYSYITYRDAKSVARETNVVTDSAHNMYLQLGATYGTIYLVSFLLIILLLSWIALKAIPRTMLGTLDYEESALSALWLAFVLQASISVDTISALVPGFLSGGLLIAKESIDKTLGQARAKRESLKIAKVKFKYVTLSTLIGIATLLPMGNQLGFVQVHRPQQ